MEETVWSEFVKGVLNIMDNRLVSIILYGSVARGTNTEGVVLWKVRGE